MSGARCPTAQRSRIVQLAFCLPDLVLVAGWLGGGATSDIGDCVICGRYVKALDAGAMVNAGAAAVAVGIKAVPTLGSSMGIIAEIGCGCCCFWPVTYAGCINGSSITYLVFRRSSGRSLLSVFGDSGARCERSANNSNQHC